MAKTKSKGLLKTFLVFTAIAFVATTALFQHNMNTTQVLGDSGNEGQNYGTIAVGAVQGNHKCLTSSFGFKISIKSTITVGKNSRGFLCEAYRSYAFKTNGCYDFTPTPIKGYDLQGIYRKNIWGPLDKITYYKGAKTIRLCDGNMAIFNYKNPADGTE